MPRLPGICAKCGAIYPSPLRADEVDTAPAFDVPAPCPVCGASGRVPPEILRRLAGLVEMARDPDRDEVGIERVAAGLREAALAPGEETPDPEEVRVRRERLRSRLASETPGAGDLADLLPGLRSGEVEAFVRLLRIAAARGSAGPGGGEGEAGESAAGGVERLLAQAYRRHGPADGPGQESGSADQAERARRRLAEAGRNDPCPCGSGEKYKDCHWIRDLRESR